MGAHTGSLEAKATSLREHWFKEYVADSNTPGNMDERRGAKNRDDESEELFLARQRLIDRGVHRLDSTPRHRTVNVRRFRGRG